MIKKIRQWYYHQCADAHARAAIDQLRQLEGRFTTPQQRFDLPFAFKGKGLFQKMAPRQNIDEIRRMYQKVCDLRPRRMLEIGTARGGSLYLWTQACADDAMILSVDLPGGEFGGGYPQAKRPFYESFARPNQTLRLLRADSHSPDTLKQVQAMLAGQPLDFLFIDGDHTYEGVKADFELYKALVRPGGLIGMHDILPRPDSPDIQVDRFWAEVKTRYGGEEIVGAAGTGRTIGIGVIQLGGANH